MASKSMKQSKYGQGLEISDLEQQGNDGDTIPLSSAKDASGKPAMLHSTPSEGGSVEPSPEEMSISPRLPRRAILFCLLIMLLGLGAAGAFVGLGLSDIEKVQDELFDRRSSEIADEIVTTFKMFEDAALYVHSACRDGVTHEGFFEVYQHVDATGLPFNVLSFLPNTTHDRRQTLENETRAYYQEQDPLVNYTGFSGFQWDPNGGSNGPRSEQPFYFPTHYAAPLSRLPVDLDFDLYSMQKETIDLALKTWKPTLTPRLPNSEIVLPNEVAHRTVILFHPGIPLRQTRPDLKPRDIATVSVNVADHLRFATRTQVESIEVFVYDSTDSTGSPEFLGGITVSVEGQCRNHTSTIHDEISLQDLEVSRGARKQKKTDIELDGRTWTLVVLAVPGTYQANRFYVILGGVLIVAACVFIVAWLYATLHREAILNRIRHASEVEKAAMMIQSANQAVQMERELNDFIAHEVRNPLSAAMSACTFVSITLKDETKSLMDQETKETTLEDVSIIESSLAFINDLLRNMLDMQRATCSELTVTILPTNIKTEVLQLVDTMLYTRGEPQFRVEVDCPDDLIVMTDRLRLAQIILNLGRNAVKVVERGFVRLRATVAKNGNVRIFVEDSGPGIAVDQREDMFKSFHGRLGSPLNQGTGLGLSLCEKLADLIGAKIIFDETYTSGIQGCPGTRFVLELCRPPLHVRKPDLKPKLSDLEIEAVPSPSSNALSSTGGSKKPDLAVSMEPPPVEERTLPESLSVLFVDDDKILRKLFTRALKKVAPGWNVQEAASGEEALQRVETETFDLIFLDQYMTSVEQQMLGTETARELRAKGVTSMICGLSANNTKDLFLESGANAFMIKPFPCEKECLVKELVHLLNLGPAPQVRVAKMA